MAKIDKENIGFRLQSAVRTLGYSKNSDFFRDSGVNEATFYAIIKENRKPSSKTMELLEKAGIDGDWLLTGKGEVLKEKTQEISFYPGKENLQLEGTKKVSDLINEYEIQRQGYQGRDSIDSDFWRLLMKFLLEMSQEDLKKIRTIIDLLTK